ncbi:MAG TPA: TPM domain-containing protein [Polyangia bacterium]|jgi:uncharacterized protein|nr:TPM domain-containing protein [Polyangia bacterium]
MDKRRAQRRWTEARAWAALGPGVALGAIVALGAVLLAAPAAYALDVPPKPTQPVNDYSHTLSADAVARLNQQLLSYEPGTTRQIAVAIFPSLDGEELFDFTMRVAEAWKIGSKKNNDGVLVTLFIQDHKDFIAVGYGLEGQLTDAQTGRIRTELMEPRFKAGDFEGGLRAGLAAIDTATGGHPHDEGKLPAAAPRGAGNDSGSPIPIFVFMAIVIVIVVLRSRGGRGGGGGGWFIGTGGGGWSSGGSGGGSSWGGGGGSFGGGGSGGSW